MENVNIFLDNGIETNVNGIFYVFDSKYYFIYTTGELEENEYVKLYVVQICKEVQNTPTGPIDTGYLLGMEINTPEEWRKVQQSITKIVEDKKNNTHSPEIQYLPMNMLVNLKIASKNKFKLLKQIVKKYFNLYLTQSAVLNDNNDLNMNPFIETNGGTNADFNVSSLEEAAGDVIIDYRARFFEEQEKNSQLEEQIRFLNEKLENIKTIIG